MPLINWSSEYSVQVAEMDEHHKKLIDIINNLHDAMKVGKGNDRIAATLDELINYTKFHFSAEEALLQKHNYAGLVFQKNAHQEFVKKINDFKNDYANGKLALSLEMMNFLKDWLLKHISGADKQYGPVLNAKGVK